MTPTRARRTRRSWQLDQDYWERLSPVQRAWLNQFNNEYYNADVYDGAALFHVSPEQRKACRKRKDVADRDVYTIHECSNRLSFGLFDLDFYIYTRLWNPQFQARSTNKGRGRNGFF